MNRGDIILTAFAPAKGARHTPVQVQKLLFLIDKEIPHLVDGPYFDFKPYNYGPFDATIYNELLVLTKDNFVEIIFEENWRSYRLTDTGQQIGDKLLNSLTPQAQQFIQSLSEFIRSLSFAQLVSAIYKAFPEMKVNSVFQGCE
jgi:uncharacterized protein